MTKIVPPENMERNAAFAAALAELIPEADPDMSRIKVLTDYSEHRRNLIARASLGAYASGGRNNVPQGVLHGLFGVTLEQYRAVHMLIYQNTAAWSRDVTGGGNDEEDA
jgi:hypothetical protein